MIENSDLKIEVEKFVIEISELRSDLEKLVIENSDLKNFNVQLFDVDIKYVDELFNFSE